MPPPASKRPDDAAHAAALNSLEGALDQIAATTPNPGRTDTFRRLTRTEYRNAIRDLLALEVDTAALLPNDSSAYGFDNITVGNLSATLLERYVSAAEKISQLAVGRPSLSPGGATVRLRPDLTQEKHLDGLPLGTRGGALVRHEFPANGDYEITIRLARDRNEHVEGLLEPHEVELLVDGERVSLFTCGSESGCRERGRAPEDARAGQRRDRTRSVSRSRRSRRCCSRPRVSPTKRISTTIAIRGFSLRCTKFRSWVHTTPAGAGDTPSRRRVFSCSDQSDGCAKKILSALMRRAYRRPVTDADLQKPFELYRERESVRRF